MEELHPDFDKMDGLLPVVIQDYYSQNVLMLGFMNEAAFTKTKAEKRVTFYSRTKKRLWTKGETSGNFLEVKTVTLDCDRDTLLIKAIPSGPVCHTGQDTCFGSDVNSSTDLGFLEKIIQQRKANPQTGSYTNSLLDSGMNKVAQKVGEEAVELVIEAKDNDPTLFLNEAADLMYHYLVLLTAKDHSLDDVIKVLRERHSTEQ